MDKLFSKLHAYLDAFFAEWEELTGLRTKTYTIKGKPIAVNWPLVVFLLLVLGVFCLLVAAFGG